MLFIPEIICTVWQPQQHHPLSTSARKHAVASWVQNLCEIMFLITCENGTRAEKRVRKGGLCEGGAEKMRNTKTTESNFGLFQRKEIVSSQEKGNENWAVKQG